MLFNGPDIGAIDPTTDVCPTGALIVDPQGRPHVTPELCVGCGICAVRCPVDAIRIDASTAIATIAPSFPDTPSDEKQFYMMRESTASNMIWESRPWADAQLVTVQVQRLADVFRTDPSKAFSGMRLLLRNALLLGGVPAKLRKQGANSMVVEVAGECDGSFLVAQVQASNDTLDPFRRLLVGLAHLLGAQGYEKKDFTPVVVILGLPNSRADYYRLVADVRKFLGVEVRTVTAAWLYLAIRDGGLTLRNPEEIPVSEEGSEGLGSHASAVFGRVIGDKCGLDPLK